MKKTIAALALAGAMVLSLAACSGNDDTPASSAAPESVVEPVESTPVESTPEESTPEESTPEEDASEAPADESLAESVAE